ncbi:Wzz/FepE/Etk N-terminal domain-containing protein [Amnibacterium setariae]|uniref:Wzz/FepE/Etk N-terminal domain-containing protein n=1 Tax=Amnibacterium setariae TaxID=2306585 RepID=UPI001314C98A|nr:Wzz/FepE/Etk N-terminal domain-containing protein [Amnibacterium setariae]
MPAKTDEWSLDVGQVVRRIGRRWKLIVVVCLATAALASAAGVVAPRHYEATASVAVLPVRLPGSNATPTINIDTERAVMLSREVAAIAAGLLRDGTTADMLDQSVSVAAPQGSEVLQVTVLAGDPDEAAKQANALASAYQQFRAQGALQTAGPSIAALDEQIAAAPRDSRSRVDLLSQRTALQHVGDATSRVIGKAVAPTSPSSFGIAVFVMGGLGGGLLLGAVVALLWDVTDPRVRFSERLLEVTRARVVRLQPADELETTRWMLRAASAAHSGRPAVAVLFGKPDQVGRIIEAARGAAPRLGRSVEQVQVEQLPDGVLDRGWRYQREDDVDLVCIDASGVRSEAQRAVLISEADVVSVVADRRTRTSEVRDVLALSDLDDGHVLVPIFIERSASRAAEATAGAAADQLQWNDESAAKEFAARRV